MVKAPLKIGDSDTSYIYINEFFVAVKYAKFIWKNLFDNTIAESFFKQLKTELSYGS